jgi:acetoin utilization protein AcuC
MYPDPRERPVYIGSEIYRGSTYGPKHPLAIPRVSTVTDLVRAMGWLNERVFVTAPMASVAAVTRFHDPDYVAALRRAEDTQGVSEEDRARFRIGAEGNPVYREIYRRPMTSAGGVMLAARLTLPGSNGSSISTSTPITATGCRTRSPRTGGC